MPPSTWKGCWRALLVQQPANVPNLLNGRFDEGLAAKSRIDRHHQHEIEVGQDLFHSRNRCGRVQGDARENARVLNLVDDPVDVTYGFDMDSYEICPCLG